MPAPKSEHGSRKNPLAAYVGAPLFSGGGDGHSRYVGRLIIEVWEVEGLRGDHPGQLALTTDCAAGTSPRDLIERVARILPASAAEIRTMPTE